MGSTAGTTSALDPAQTACIRHAFSRDRVSNAHVNSSAAKFGLKVEI